MAEQTSALRKLLRGVRLPRDIVNASRHGSQSPGETANGLEDDGDEQNYLPPQLDFFRQQSQHVGKESGNHGSNSRKRPRAQIELESFANDKLGHESEINRANSNSQTRSVVADIGSLSRMQHLADDERSMAVKLAERLCGQMAIARGLIALGAGVLTQVQERAMGLVACGRSVTGDAQSDDETVSLQPSNDIIAVAPTGSGKTLCYAAPICAHLMALRNEKPLKEKEKCLVAGQNSSDVLARARTKARRARSKLKSKQPKVILTDNHARTGLDEHVDNVSVSLVQLSPTLRSVDSRKVPFCLVLTPTRELAVQVGGVFERLAAASRMKLAVSVIASKSALTGLGEANLDVVVATPQRCVLALDRRLIDLSALQHVVLDEADRLLDDGFIAQVDAVLAECGSQRRLHSFSATMPPATEQIIRGLCESPKKIVVGGGSYGGSAAVADIARTIKQKFMFVGGKGEQGKVLAVRGMLKDGLQPPVLLFVQTKERAAELFRELIYDGVNIDAIHADRSGAARSSAIARFRAGRVPILIATDILARGLDFRAVSTVINYDMPSSAEAYVHRIGRTGRNGRPGCAITLFTEEDSELLRAIANVARAGGAEIPEWMLAQKRLRRDRALALEKNPPRRQQIGGSSHATLRRRGTKAINPGFSKKRSDLDDLKT